MEYVIHSKSSGVNLQAGEYLSSPNTCTLQIAYALKYPTLESAQAALDIILSRPWGFTEAQKKGIKIVPLKTQEDKLQEIYKEMGSLQTQLNWYEIGDQEYFNLLDKIEDLRIKASILEEDLK